jgi:hypothetical protein
MDRPRLRINTDLATPSSFFDSSAPSAPVDGGFPDLASPAKETTSIWIYILVAILLVGMILLNIYFFSAVTEQVRPKEQQQ